MRFGAYPQEAATARSEHRGAVTDRAGGHARRGVATTEALRGGVRELLDELGYRALTIERVAARSGVAKTSICRRWPWKAEMAFDLLLHASDALPPLDDRGGLAGVLDALAGRVAPSAFRRGARTSGATLAAPVGGHRAGGQLRLVGSAQLARHDHVQLRPQSGGPRGGDRDAPAGDAQHQGVLC